MADTKISAMTAATAATASTVPVVQGGVNKKLSMTGAGAAMIEAADAAAQRTTLACPGLTTANIFTVNGAASTPAMSLTGAVFTGGTSTTTKPLFLIEPAGATSTGWSTAGTMFGVNAASGFAGRLADLQLNGASAFSVNYTGAIRCGNDGSFPLVINGLYGQVQFVQLGDGALQASHTLRASVGFIADNGSSFTISNTAGQLIISNVGFAYTSSGVARISDGSSGRATLDAAAYQVGGTAGASGTVTAASTVTVVNGIITNIA